MWVVPDRFESAWSIVCTCPEASTFNRLGEDGYQIQLKPLTNNRSKSTVLHSTCLKVTTFGKLVYSWHKRTMNNGLKPFELVTLITIYRSNTYHHAHRCHSCTCPWCLMKSNMEHPQRPEKHTAQIDIDRKCISTNTCITSPCGVESMLVLIRYSIVSVMPLSSLITALWHYAIVRHFTVEVLSVLTNVMNRVGLRDKHSVRVIYTLWTLFRKQCTGELYRTSCMVGSGQNRTESYWCL